MPVQAEVRYLNEEWREREDIPQIGDRESRRANTSKHTVSIHDARPGLLAGEIDLDINGFTLLGLDSEVRDFHDEGEVRRVYYPEIEALTKRTTGADEVFITQHLVRTEDTADFNRAYARFLHCDYSLDGAREAALRIIERRGLDAARYADAEFAWYNAWQPFDHVVQRNPLALVDAASLAFDDIVDYQYTGYSGRARPPGDEPAMQSKSSMPARNPAHRFYYVSRMDVDEVLFFKQLDTRRQGGACPHTSFDDPASPQDAPPRRSVETRLMAVFRSA